MENKFKFKKDNIEIEFSGEKDFVESQVKNWESRINKLLSDDSITDVNEVLNNPTDLNSLIKDSPVKEFEIPVLNTNIQEIQDIPYNEIKVTKNITIDDFLKLKEPENDTDKVLVAAYYLEKYEKYDSFSEMDLYRILNVSNIENQLLINMENGYLSFLNKKNSLNMYTLTYSGEMYVREGLQHV